MKDDEGGRKIEDGRMMKDEGNKKLQPWIFVVFPISLYGFWE